MKETPIACCTHCTTAYTWGQFRSLELLSPEDEQPERRTCALCTTPVYLVTTGLGPAMFLEHDDGTPILGQLPHVHIEHKPAPEGSVALRVLLVLALLLWAGFVGWILWRGWWSK